MRKQGDCKWFICRDHPEGCVTNSLSVCPFEGVVYKDPESSRKLDFVDSLLVISEDG